MKTVAVVHHTLNNPGGGERLCISVIEALRSAGYRVILATVEKTDWNRVYNAFRKDIKVDEETWILSRALKRFGIYQRSLSSLMVPRLRRRADLIINTHGDVGAVPTDIMYMHYPLLVLLKAETRFTAKYYGNPFWTLYFTPYQFAQDILAKLYARSTLLLTNSKFSAEAIRSSLKIDPLVVYPPVSVENFLPLATRRKRSDLVLTISRLVPEKKLDLIPQIAARSSSGTFAVVGTREKDSGVLIERIERRAKELGVKDRVQIHPDASFRRKLELLSEAKIYLHTMPYEHFGIAVVEGMASGCVPLTHRSGGAWMDILGGQQALHGFGYESAQEAAQQVELILRDDRMREAIVERNLCFVTRFSERNFQERILGIVKKCLLLKEHDR